MLPRFALSALLALLAIVATAIAGSGPARTERVSTSSQGAQTERQSRGPSLSHDGRFVAFASWDRGLVAGDTNGWIDAFVHDRTTGTTKRVSVSSSGRQGNQRSNWPSISSDGRFVAFESRASNLAPGDSDKGWDVFVRDLKRNTTRLVSIQPGGKHGGGAPFISADGRSVAFEGYSTAGATGEIFVRNLRTHRTERVPAPHMGDRVLRSITPSLSGDGRLVAFVTDAEFSTPIPRSGMDVFVRDLKTHTTEQASVSPHPRQTEGFSNMPRISANGRFVAFGSGVDLITGDRNGEGGIFRRDLESHKTERINTGDGCPCALSANGRFLAFGSFAPDVVPGDTNEALDVFLRDIASGTTTRVSVSDSGEQATSGSRYSYDASSENPAISGDGRFVGFQSPAANLVAGDTNSALDIFVRGPLRP